MYLLEWSLNKNKSLYYQDDYRKKGNIKKHTMLRSWRHQMQLLQIAGKKTTPPIEVMPDGREVEDEEHDGEPMAVPAQRGRRPRAVGRSD